MTNRCIEFLSTDILQQKGSKDRLERDVTNWNAMMTNSILFLQVLLLIMAQTITAKTETSSLKFDGLKTWKSSIDLLGKLLLTSKHDRIFGKTPLLVDDDKHEELLKMMKMVLHLVRYGKKPTSNQESILSKDCSKSFDDMIAQKNYKKILQRKSLD